AGHWRLFSGCAHLRTQADPDSPPTLVSPRKGCGPTLRSRHLAELLSRVVDDLSRLQTAREGEIGNDEHLALGSEQLQWLRRWPVGILEDASPLVWYRLSHAWQRRRSRGCRARGLATLAND